MKHKLSARISGYAKQIYLKTRCSLLAVAERLREKKHKHLLKRLLRNYDPQELEHELRRHHNTFAYLLEPTMRFLLGTPTPYFSTFESLNSAWNYCLDDGRIPCLQRLYREIQTAVGENVLRLWMTYLRQQGFRRMQEEMNTVIISPAARKLYDNTLGLVDGMSLPIESHPWTYKEELMIGGMLERCIDRIEAEL